ncbi:MAG: ScpA family protein [Thalassobaculum sp.]|uniref:segregation and condensation protein A n=1 Tax=Thalassobaculum sp. TaxID=2022740 RepID=UPI0032EEDF23
MATHDPFESPEPEYRRREPVQLSLFLNLDGFEGPIDVLLTLARDQKVDLTQISILQLAEQYLVFIREAQVLNLELAADYLVMAAWLAYLKSRLLLPVEEGEEEEQDPAALAEALRFQLQRLEAMQEAGTRLMALPQLGVDVFGRGAPENLSARFRSVYDVTLYDLLRAYADHKVREQGQTLTIAATDLYAVEDAIERLRGLVGRVPEWRTLFSFLPEFLKGSLVLRSAVASTFVASLQLVKDGEAQLRQEGTFGPIWLRSPSEGSSSGGPSSGGPSSGNRA